MADNTSTQFDLKQLYLRAFGHVGLPYPALGVGKGLNPLKTVKNTIKGAFNFRSEMGGEYMFPVEIDGWQLPNEPLVSIRGSNHIIETPLNRGERVANVLEQVNLDNYQITIRGLCVSDEPDTFPEDQVQKLRKILEKKGSRTITCDYLTLFNINKIAIKNIDWPALEGAPEVQPYTIRCISDEDFELELINDLNK